MREASARPSTSRRWDMTDSVKTALWLVGGAAVARVAGSHIGWREEANIAASARPESEILDGTSFPIIGRERLLLLLPSPVETERR